MSTWKKIAEGLIPVNNEVSFAAGKLGNFAIGKPSRRLVGGRIFYDNGPEAEITYKFYKTDGTEIEYEYDSSDATHVVTALQAAYEYEVRGGEPSVDRFYVFNNDLQTNKQWGKLGIEIGITSNGIGLGKSNTKTALEQTDWEDNSMFKYISNFNDDNETGCKDWYIGSEAEQDKLIAVANTFDIKWYTNNWVWSSVERNASTCYAWAYDAYQGPIWNGRMKNAAYGRDTCFAMRSF